MRRLVILRHAKAANPQGLDDHERPLAPRGRADAVAAGAWLAAHDSVPDLVLCSTSRRTRETWDGVAAAMTDKPTVRYDERVYLASALDLLELVTEVDDEISTLAVVGHNPGTSQLSRLLDPVNGGELATAGIAVHELDQPWRATGPDTAALVQAHTARG
jgi:phosphohistidine phosphatase